MALCLYMHLFCVAGMGCRTSHMSGKWLQPRRKETLLVYALKLRHSHHTELPVLQLPHTNMLLNSQVFIVDLALCLHEET